MKFERKGDKENSAFFEEYLPKIYERREKSGLDDLIDRMRGIVIQVQTGDALAYLAELYLMTPYRLIRQYQNATHRVFVLRVKPEQPDLFVLEPLELMYADTYRSLNIPYMRARSKPNVRYIGEIYGTKNLGETRRILEAQEFRFRENAHNGFIANPHFAFTEPSYYTSNCVGYTSSDLLDTDSLELGEPFAVGAEEQKTLNATDALQREFGLYKLVWGVDHMASRVLCGDREHAILEFLCLNNYYFWGAYTIDDQNSSTNITRNPKVTNELHSPAKVFTANNTPFYVKTVDGLPSPTEDFVRNFGRRMHHVAYEVEDGQREDGQKNIDYVVGKIQELGGKFLAQIIGECKDFPDLKQIFSRTSQYSNLITEYVQRCKGFDGFFTKSNVAFLTQAAGLDEKLDKQVTSPLAAVFD